MINFDKIHTEITKEISFYPNGFGLRRLYKLVLSLCNNNDELATAFLTSAKGGYTKVEINNVKYRIRYDETRRSTERSN